MRLLRDDPNCPLQLSFRRHLRGIGILGAAVRVIYHLLSIPNKERVRLKSAA